MNDPLEWADIDGLCGDQTCRVRVHMSLWLPGDPLVIPPCAACADAARAALLGAQGDRLRALSVEARR
ncbi:hypothetical protein [Nocardioides ochotonae]|uniref:hypothetical protein n=1 Tax=Nocardioides ochotonae TaxID=2685869 RepID=UPI00140885CE|nr:hypothetical protein [Nocardioides ochotonae]